MYIPLQNLTWHFYENSQSNKRMKLITKRIKKWATWRTKGTGTGGLWWLLFSVLHCLPQPCNLSVHSSVLAHQLMSSSALKLALASGKLVDGMFQQSGLASWAPRRKNKMPEVAAGPRRMWKRVVQTGTQTRAQGRALRSRATLPNPWTKKHGSTIGPKSSFIILSHFR